MAAPSKFDAATLTAIMESKRKGQTDAQAARHAGIGARTLRSWLRAGRSGDDEFVQLSQAYTRSVEQYRKERTRQIVAAAGMAA